MWQRLNIPFTVLWAIGAVVGLVATVIGPIPIQPAHLERAEQDERQTDEKADRPEPAEEKQASAPAKRDPQTPAAARGPLSDKSFDVLRDRIDSLEPEASKGDRE